ncbi:cell division protein SepF [Streptobacillus felis]|uniref:Cell division protein SepF n=1 Tax=Streptobacillus felis TaxID=1384509 RepID=A0A7Z0T7D9_9FUSO|nr:cell division protein SepF [Streptobacillus felis]NYV28191.1 cell division protein SepF [Streptobacillus felis]
MSFLKKLFGSDDLEEEYVEEQSVVDTQNETSGITLFKKDNKKIKREETDMKFIAIRPKNMNETTRFVDLIKSKAIITFNLDGLNREEGQRMIDILSGATRAMSGKTVFVSDKVFISIPEGVEVDNLLKNGEEIE